MGMVVPLGTAGRLPARRYILHQRWLSTQRAIYTLPTQATTGCARLLPQPGLLQPWPAMVEPVTPEMTARLQPRNSPGRQGLRWIRLGTSTLPMRTTTSFVKYPSQAGLSRLSPAPGHSDTWVTVDRQQPQNSLTPRASR